MTPISPVVGEYQKPLEDPLSYLPRSSIVEYKKGAVIYNQHQHGTHLCLIVEGKVKISRVTDAGKQVVVDVYQQDEFFGEGALLPDGPVGEQATAVENTKIMSWTATEIQQLIVHRPRLGIAFMQILAQRSIDFTHRIESLSCDNIARRLARALIRFSARLGVETEAGDGSIRMPPLTHEMLGQYVGTSREIITQYMNQFRQGGYLTYSRREVILFRDPLCEWIRQN